MDLNLIPAMIVAARAVSGSANGILVDVQTVKNEAPSYPIHNVHLRLTILYVQISN
jgi:hypothetical protein